jgi:hypothetical protein
LQKSPRSARVQFKEGGERGIGKKSREREREENDYSLSEEARSVDMFEWWMADKAPLKPSFSRANNP